MRKILLAGMNYRGYDERICCQLEGLGKECIQIPFTGKSPTAGYNIPVLGAAAHRASSITRRSECHQFMSEVVAPAIRNSNPHAILFVNPVFMLDRQWVQRGWPPMYSWLMDPVWRYKQFEETIGVSTATFSYDSRDCMTYGLTELPLFSLSSNVSNGFEERATDFCFIGSLYPERTRALNRIIEFCTSYGKSFRFLGELHSFTRLTKPFLSLRFPALFKQFELKPLSPEQCLNSYARSKCIVNFHASGHYGFSMRTFEALASGANVLTELTPSGELASAFGNRILVARNNDEIDDALLRRCLEQASVLPTQAAVESLSLRSRLVTLLRAIGE